MPNIGSKLKRSGDSYVIDADNIDLNSDFYEGMGLIESMESLINPLPEPDVVESINVSGSYTITPSDHKKQLLFDTYGGLDISIDESKFNGDVDGLYFYIKKVSYDKGVINGLPEKAVNLLEYPESKIIIRWSSGSWVVEPSNRVSLCTTKGYLKCLSAGQRQEIDIPDAIDIRITDSNSPFRIWDVRNRRVIKISDSINPGRFTQPEEGIYEYIIFSKEELILEHIEIYFTCDLIDLSIRQINSNRLTYTGRIRYDDNINVNSPNPTIPQSGYPKNISSLSARHSVNCNPKNWPKGIREFTNIRNNTNGEISKDIGINLEILNIDYLNISATIEALSPFVKDITSRGRQSNLYGEITDRFFPFCVRLRNYRSNMTLNLDKIASKLPICETIGLRFINCNGRLSNALANQNLRSITGVSGGRDLKGQGVINSWNEEISAQGNNSISSPTDFSSAENLTFFSMDRIVRNFHNNKYWEWGVLDNTISSMSSKSSNLNNQLVFSIREAVNVENGNVLVNTISESNLDLISGIKSQNENCILNRIRNFNCSSLFIFNFNRVDNKTIRVSIPNDFKYQDNNGVLSLAVYTEENLQFFGVGEPFRLEDTDRNNIDYYEIQSHSFNSEERYCQIQLNKSLPSGISTGRFIYVRFIKLAKEKA